jgi:hypothetical protein
MKTKLIFNSRENLKCGFYGVKIVSMVVTLNIFWNGLKINLSALLVAVIVGVISSKLSDDLFLMNSFLLILLKI